MASQVQPEVSQIKHSPTANFETDLAMEFLRVVEEAAIASAKTMGQGDRKHADQVATEAMRGVMDSVPMDGTIVIGEGERDEAPMLYIGEKVGKHDGGTYPSVDIAVDPLEGTNLCATGSPGAITVLAASEGGGLLHAPDCYMEKIVVGPSCRGVVDLEAPVVHNLNVIAKVLGRRVEDLVIIILDRPRHENLIAEIRKAGARIRLISDGDLSPGVAAAMLGSGVHAVMGTGGAPEGVITAAAMRCLNGYMVGRLVGYTPEQGERMKDMGISDPEAHLHGRRTRARQEHHLRRHRRDRWTVAQGRALLRRRRAYHLAGHEAQQGQSALYREHSPRQASGREGQNSRTLNHRPDSTQALDSRAFFFDKGAGECELAAYVL